MPDEAQRVASKICTPMHRSSQEFIANSIDDDECRDYRDARLNRKHKNFTAQSKEGATA
jgi:hypothetical protein